MVVTYFEDPDERLAWMIPVDTIVRYVEQIADWVGPDIDPQPRAMAVVVVGGPTAQGVDSPLGEVKLTVDAAGRSVAEVRRRIEDRISTTGIDLDSADSGKTPVTVVLAGIDASDEPDALLTEVAKPLLDSGTEVEFRFSDETSPRLGRVHQWQREEIAARITKLAARLEKVTTLEAETRARAERSASRVAGPTPEIPLASVDLQLRMRSLSSPPAHVDPARVRRALVSTERKTERALRTLAEVGAEIDAAGFRYEELRGLLRAYNARAKDHGLVEDPELSALHRPAAQAVARRPCSVAQAEPLVDAYVRAVRQRLLDGPGDRR